MNASHRHLSTLQSWSIHTLQYGRPFLPLNQGEILPAPFECTLNTENGHYKPSANCSSCIACCSFFFFLEKHEYQRTMKGWAGGDQWPHTIVSRSGQLYQREKKKQISIGGTRATQLHCTLRSTSQRWRGPLTPYRFHWNTVRHKIPLLCTSLKRS